MAYKNTISEEKFIFKIITVNDIEKYEDSLKDLHFNTEDENPFLQPEILFPALKYLGNNDIKIAIIQSENQDVLYAFMPIAKQQRRYGIFSGPLFSWIHAYSPLGNPVIRHNAISKVTSVEIAKQLLTGITHYYSKKPLLLFPSLPIESQNYKLLCTAAEHLKWNIHKIRIYNRASLKSENKFEEYISKSFSKKQLREHKRLWRRLNEKGKVSYKTTFEIHHLENALQEFFCLEMQGWKGKAGTALLANNAHKNFFTEACINLANSNKIRIDTLYIDDIIIASLISIIGDKWIYTWKTAFNENYTNYAPGFLLLYKVTQELISDSHGKPVDSLAVPKQKPISKLWQEKRQLADIILAPSGIKNKFLILLNTNAEKIRDAAKKLYNKTKRK
jgi:hypothetical protein